VTAEPTTVSALVVAYGAEPELGDCLDAILASEGVIVDVVVVDNGDRSGHLARFADEPRVAVYRPGTNLGFAGGCNAAAEHAAGEVLVLVNPDVAVQPQTLARLAAVALEAGVGIATASVRLASEPAVMNSAGNPVHYLGLAWAGGHGEPASMHAEQASVASASGACCAIRADLWRELGGFDPAYFAYHEDVEISLRCWQRGRQVVYVPDAIALHHYEFSRNTGKNYLLERNRLVTVLTTYSGRTLVMIAGPLIALEVSILAVAAAGGWLPAKLRGYRWIVTHAPALVARHRRLQGERTRSDRELIGLFETRFEATNVPDVRAQRALNQLSTGYGRILRRIV
jgi:GT2 family glycosyltransferase